MVPRIDIGIDGGGTGCRVAVSLDGGEAVETRGGPANIVTDQDAAEAAIIGALTDALAAFDLRLSDLDAARTCAGLAGGRLPGVADAFATRLPFAVEVVDDSQTALMGALGDRTGTLASLGTGSFFVRKDGETLRHIGGWGFALGDEGSAAWLGRRALSAALRVADGRLPPDPLAEALMHAAPPHPSVFARDAKPGEYAQIAKVVLAHGYTPLAQSLVRDVLEALSAGLGDVGHVPGTALVLTGGLGDLLQDHLPKEIRADLVPAKGRPLDGALALARALP